MKEVRRAAPPGVTSTERRLTTDHRVRGAVSMAARTLPQVSTTPEIARGRGRGWLRETTQCPAGHTYTQDNTYMFGGSRHCRTCRRLRRREWQSKRPFRREHAAWSHAKRRCSNPRVANYNNYGGRGIYMVVEWRESFARFLADMGPCPPGLTLDRINNDGPYAPGNCRWADHKTQTANRRKVRHRKGERFVVCPSCATKFPLKNNCAQERGSR